MRTQSKRRRPKGAGAHRLRRGPLLALLVCVGCLSLEGCAGQKSAQTAADPLLGDKAPIPANPVAAAPTVPTGPLPPLPAPNPAGSNAALAAGPTKPLDDNHDLRIGAPIPVPDNRGNSPPPAGTILNQPQPVFTPVSQRQPDATQNLGAAAGSRLDSYEQAQNQLASRGVTWQRLETGSGPSEWKFSCSVPNRQNPNISRTYEAKAQGCLDAIQAVLDQIDKDK